MSEHCVRHCTLIMVCGIVLGKAKTTKVGMVWYEFNIVNESINESVTKVGIELLGQLKTQMIECNCNCLDPHCGLLDCCCIQLRFVRC